MKDYRKDIASYISLETAVLQELRTDQINDVLNILEQALEQEQNIYIFGNGGSAATASHFQNDFNKGVSEHTGKKLAIANDIGYEEIFRFQLRGKVKKGDVVIAISGSGNSKNVLYAAEYAKENGAAVVGMTGFSGGRLKEICDYPLHVPVHSMQITEDIHMVFDHLMMSVFYKSLCGIDHRKE